MGVPSACREVPGDWVASLPWGMITPNPIRLAIASAAFGAGASLIIFGAIKGAVDIMTETRPKRAPGQPAGEPDTPEPSFVHVETDDGDDYSV